MTESRLAIIESEDGSSSAAFVPDHGGLGLSLIMPVNDEPVELLHIQPKFWDAKDDAGGWCFLFPVCGRQWLEGERGGYRWNGERVWIPLHGFAMRLPWKVTHHEGNELHLEMTDSVTTRSVYPFGFRVALKYRIENGRLICRQEYENTGDTILPFYAGFHPYFRIHPDAHPLEMTGRFTEMAWYDQHAVTLEGWTPAPRRMDAVETADSMTMLRCEVGSPVTLDNGLGALITMTANHEGDTALFPYVQTWKLKRKPFVCIEPWMDYPNGLNDLDRIRKLQPGERAEATLELTVRSK